MFVQYAYRSKTQYQLDPPLLQVMFVFQFFSFKSFQFNYLPFKDGAQVAMELVVALSTSYKKLSFQQ